MPMTNCPNEEYLSSKFFRQQAVTVSQRARSKVKRRNKTNLNIEAPEVREEEECAPTRKAHNRLRSVNFPCDK